MWNRTAEPVRIDVEDGEVGEKPELLRQVPGDVGVVEINTRDNAEATVGRQLRAVDTFVFADIRSDPCPGQIQRI